MYYSATIIQMSGVHDKSTAVWMSAATASVNFFLSFVGLALVERLGRRMLILSSLIGVVFALILLGVGFQLGENNSPAVTFHTANQSICSGMDTCNQCISSKCGFCFSDQAKYNLTSSAFSNWHNSLAKAELNGTCLLVDKLNPLHAAGKCSYLFIRSTLIFVSFFVGKSFCSNGTTQDMVWANNWCPSNYSWMTLVGLMLYLFFFSPGSFMKFNLL